LIGSDQLSTKHCLLQAVAMTNFLTTVHPHPAQFSLCTSVMVFSISSSCMSAGGRLGTHSINQGGLEMSRNCLVLRELLLLSWRDLKTLCKLVRTGWAILMFM
jgi:hypothetical protein